VALAALKEGMLAFPRESARALIVEILVVRGINDKAAEIAALDDYLLRLHPDRIDLGTIDRPPAYAVRPVDYATLRELSLLFDPSLSLHITSRRDLGALTPSSYDEEEILRTLRKRPLTPEDVELLFDEESRHRLETLRKEGRIGTRENHGVKFYVPT
jgi:wyosine [tRNA(Phe)-imidazoG37] synthetase (radical SAM superfamily)